jgi:hypothetical protein
LFLILWYFGFVSFHSRENGRANSRLKDAKAELTQAQEQLSELTRVVQSIKVNSDSLDARRAKLQQQVAELEDARDLIASNLSAASKLVSSAPPSRLDSVLDFLFSGVPGSIIATIIVGACAWLYRRWLSGASKQAQTLSRDRLK